MRDNTEPRLCCSLTDEGHLDIRVIMDGGTDRLPNDIYSQSHRILFFDENYSHLAREIGRLFIRISEDMDKVSKSTVIGLEASNERES